MAKRRQQSRPSKAGFRLFSVEVVSARWSSPVRCSPLSGCTRIRCPAPPISPNPQTVRKQSDSLGSFLTPPRNTSSRNCSSVSIPSARSRRALLIRARAAREPGWIGYRRFPFRRPGFLFCQRPEGDFHTPSVCADFGASGSCRSLEKTPHLHSLQLLRSRGLPTHSALALSQTIFVRFSKGLVDPHGSATCIDEFPV
jgi:hypothetical protein